jgi:hypothetical protein
VRELLHFALRQLLDELLEHGQADNIVIDDDDVHVASSPVLLKD